MGIDGGTSEACRATFPNGQLRVVGGVSGGHGARLAERLSELSNTGGWWGLMVVGRSEAIAERPDLSFGVVVGGDGGRLPRPLGTPSERGTCVGKNRKGEKRLRPNHAVRSAEKRILRPRTKTALRTTAPRSRRGARPARQESAHGFNPKRRRACLCGGAPEEAGTSMAIAG